MSTEDEEALAWAGDNDERLTTGSTSGSPVRKPRASLSSSTEGLSSPALIGFGVLGGIYLLFTVAWLITALRNPVLIADPVGSFMFIFGLWMAVFAPAAWFGAALYFGRPRSLGWRFGFLVLGVALFVPWPFFSWAG